MLPNTSNSDMALLFVPMACPAVDGYDTGVLGVAGVVIGTEGEGNTGVAPPHQSTGMSVDSMVS